jgi:hypothetical protein
MLDYHRLWKMSDALQNGAFRVRSDRKMDREEVRKLKKGEIQPQLGVVFRHCMGGQVPKDLIGTGWGGGHFILSDRVVEALRAGKFTGWSTYPVRIIGKDGDEIPGYHGLAITGRCGPIDDLKSEVIKQLGSSKFVRVRGLFFDEKTWDGSDVFLIGHGGHICVTEAVYDAVMALKPRNIKFTRLDEVSLMLTGRQRSAG